MPNRLVRKYAAGDSDEAYLFIKDTSGPEPLSQEHRDLLSPERVLVLTYDDLKDSELSFGTPWFAKATKGERTSKALSNLALGKNSGLTLFTAYHADQVVRFARSLPFDIDIFVGCDIGRVRSLTVAKFLSDWMFPGATLKLARYDGRIDVRAYDLMLERLRNPS